MTTDAQGAPQPLGTVVNPDVWTTAPVDFGTWHGDVLVAVRGEDPPGVHTEYYRWAQSAKAFVRIDGQ
jgi:hypothetical protein